MAFVFWAGAGSAQEPPANAGDSIVVFGESHDNPAHHRNQADFIARYDPAAVVFEMIPAEREAAANAALAAGADMAAALDWANSGWPDFSLYAPIFAALGDARIYGAEVPSDTAAQAFDTPLTELFPQAALYGLDLDLPAAEDAERQADLADAHCGALPPEMLPGFVAAQRLRDAVLAETALRARAETGGLVVVITGNGHARADWGVPSLIELAVPGQAVLSIGQIEADQDGAARIDAPPFDRWLMTSAPIRDDPCAAFR